MMGEFPCLLQLNFSCVDVHDCSLAHLRALLRPEAANKRFILSLPGTISMEEIAINLRDDLTNIGKNYPVTTRVIGYCTVKFFSWFSSDISSVLPLVNRRANHNNTASVKVLDIQYRRTIREMTLASAVSMI